VLVVYVGSLVIALGILGIQIASGGHDVDAGGVDAHGDGDSTHEAGAFGTFVTSIRFWTFVLLGIGLVGTPLHLFDLASPVFAAILAATAGVGSGVFAQTVVKRILGRDASSHGSSSDVVGKLGKVVVPCVPGGRGKVRVELKGSFVDLAARSEVTLDSGESVLVVALEDTDAIVEKAPRELGTED